jgi:hypothetical protein
LGIAAALVRAKASHRIADWIVGWAIPGRLAGAAIAGGAAEWVRRLAVAVGLTFHALAIWQAEPITTTVGVALAAVGYAGVVVAFLVLCGLANWGLAAALILR